MTRLPRNPRGAYPAARLLLFPFRTRPARALTAPSYADDGRPRGSAQHRRDRARFEDREHYDRHTIFASKGKRSGVHDLQFPHEGLMVGQVLVALGGWVFLGIGGVDAVDTGRLEDRVTTHFGSAQHRGG